MKASDLGPFAVFRFKGRVYVKSAGLIQLLDRSGRYYETTGSLVGRMLPDDEVEAVDLSAPLDGSKCPVCFGSGYVPGDWNAPLHGVMSRVKCPNACPVEGGEPEKIERYVEEVCACCERPLPKCEKPAKAGVEVV